MKTVKKTIAVIMTVLMVFSALSAGMAFGASAAYGCDHNIGTEGSTMVEYSRIPSTCHTKGKAYYRCTNCTFTTAQELELDPDNHVPGDWKQVTAPTCAQDGEKIRYCIGDGCTYYETGIIPATGEHTYADEALLDFWWTADGIKVGDEYEGWIIKALPTCFDNGEASAVCTVCGGAEITVELAAHSYNFKEYKREASTCAAKGKSYVTCTVCNANFTLTLPLDEENHAWKYVVETEPTCTQNGLKVSYCPYHTDVTDGPTEIIPSTGHTFKNYVSDKNATCQSDGTKTAKCENCDVKDTVADVGSMTECFTKWQFKDENATCQTGGVAELRCVDCKKVFDIRTIPAGTHISSHKVTTKATCIKDGREDTMCTLCGVYATKVLPKTGHDTKRVNKTMPNCMTKTDRVDLIICQTCGNIEEEVTPYTHRLVNVAPAIEPTCTTAGKTAHNKCLDCDYQELPQTKAALGHNDTDNDGCCNVCYVYFVQNSGGEIVDCKCLCHNPDGIAQLFFKFINFFFKLFGVNQECDCGKIHYGVAGIN